MKTRIALAALVLTLGAPVSSALAQSYNAPAGIPAVTAPGGFAPSAYDDITTGSLRHRRSPDSSAKEGNAEQNDKPVSNYGGTAGGPAY